MNLPILMYHKIEAPQAGNDLAVSLNAFSAQMHYLKSCGFQTLALSELVAHPDQPSKQRVVITFDDAYQSVWEYAKPVLDQLGFKATVFVVAKAIGQDNFWDKQGQHSRRGCMKKTELKSLLKAGWELGSHSTTHACLVGLAAATLKAEVAGSRQLLAEELGQPIKVFCYPFGAWDLRVRQAVEQAGYVAACAISPGTSSVTADHLALRRVYVKPTDSMLAFRRKISTWYLRYRAWRKR